VILPPLAALAIAKLRRRRIVLIQHEWGGLNWMRRISYIPALLLADTIIMFSSLVRRELADDPLLGWTVRKCVLAPLPPNIEAPARIENSEFCQRLAAARASGRQVIGHFGSIYPGKQPNALLEIGAILKARGLKPLMVYIGSFIRGVDKVEKDFYARAAELALTEDVIVSGFVASDAEVFGLFSEVDAFCYPLQRPHLRPVRPAADRDRPRLAGRVRSPSALQGVDRSRRHRAGAARIDERGLCRRHRGGDQAATGAAAVRFRRVVEGCRESGNRRHRTARLRRANQV
jgi:glycosyltransferase involved in cell wall biosynthesis